MVDSKAIPGLTGTQPATTALKRILKARLVLVVKRARELSMEAESVHQLRVSSRRAAAALRLARDCIPEKKRNRALVILREIRRSAGTPRDLDIFLETVHTAAINESAKAFLAGHVAHQRVIAFTSLQTRTHARREELAQLTTLLPAAVDAGDVPFARLFARNARQTMRDFNATVESVRSNTDPAHLHQVRIQAKRLRYLLELGDTERLASLIAFIEKLQGILGRWHDTQAVIPRLETAMIAATAVNGAAGSPVSRGIESLIRTNRRIEQRELAAVRRWLRTWSTFLRRHPLRKLFPKSMPVPGS